VPDLRVLVVDDEPLVREGLRMLLERETGVRVLGEARNGEEALERIRELRPDLVLLDVRMPGMDGLAVVAALEPEERPAIVFVTAHGEYAIQAFDMHAVDYLLKPFDADRFARALRRARGRMSEGKADRLEALLATLQPARTYPERLLLKHEGTVVVVPAHDIDWIEAADNYVRIHARTGRYMAREPIKQIEAKLDPARFARVHRSAIVNLSRVKSLDPVTSGEALITLTTGTRLTLSRGYRDHFKSRLESARR
jgi:two-component system, LytTR family, response regulator